MLDLTLQRGSEAVLADLQARDRERAAGRLARKGLSTLSDYERALLGQKSIEQEQREHAELARGLARRRADVTALLRPKDITFRTPFLASLNTHAIDLAVAHGIAVHLQHSGGGSACHETRTISVPPVTSEESYATFLHECGHLLSPDADDRQFRRLITTVNKHAASVSPDAETGAWRWAIVHAWRWTRAMHDSMYASQKFYAAYATDDERQRMSAFVSSSAFRIVDTPLTFKALDAQQAALVGAAMPGTIPR